MKNPPAMHEMQVQSLSWEDPLEKKMQPTPVFLLGKSHGQRRLVGYIVQVVARVGHDLGTKSPPQTQKVHDTQ